MKPNLFRTIILPLLWRGLGGGVLLLPAVAFAQAPNLTVCTGKGYTLTSNVEASGTSPVTYEWYESVNGAAASTIPNSNTPSISIPGGKAEAGTYAYVRKAANTECPDGIFSNTYTVVVNAKPTITLASGSSAQTVTIGSAITQIKYTTANASGATTTGLPSGVSGVWASNTYTISGTPASDGAYNYTVTTTNSNGCANATATGTITMKNQYNCLPSTLTLTGVGFANSNIYTYNGITLSAYVTVTTCQKTTYNGGTTSAYNADCRSNPSYGGDLFSWCMVEQYASELCPLPWRVPTIAEYCSYSGLSNCASATTNIKAGVHDWSLDGLCDSAGNLSRQGSWGYTWSRTVSSVTFSQSIAVGPNSFQPSSTQSYKDYGMSLRCVQ